uniref:Translationally-controlled tumor protein homolog n=1 Tax=Rhodnius neglectus TaxID=72488 RepID=A0A0N7Z9P1_9HEMI
MFSDSYKMKLVGEVMYEVYGKLVTRKHGEIQLDGFNPSAEEADEVMYEVYGKLVTRKHGEIQLDGFNPSAEEADEGTDVAVESGVDVVLNHRLCETYAFGDKKAYTAYPKDYMKKLVAKLEEKSPEQVDTFKTNMNKVMKELLGRFKELQFFTGESMDVDGMIALLEYRDIDNESVPVLMFFKHGLEEEKF